MGRRAPDGYDRARHGVHNLQRPEVVADPRRYLDAIAALPPVFYDEVGGVWVCQGYAEAADILAGHRLFSSARHHSAAELRRRGLGRVAAIADMLSAQMLFSDPPEQARIRRSMSAQFQGAGLRQREAGLRALAADRLARLPAAGTVDLVTDFAEPLATGLITHLLRMEDQAERLCRWAGAYETLLGSLSTFPHLGDQSVLPALEDGLASFRELARERLAEPGDDPVSALAAALAEPGQDRPDSTDRLDVIAANCLVLAAGGYQTLTHLVSRGLLLLAEHPAQLDLLRARPDLAESAVDEIMRLEGSSQYVGRRVTADTTVGDAELAAGETVLVLLGAANLDERKFPQARTLDITRRQGRHLGFGAGAHYCLGAPFAERMAAFALAGFVRRYPGYGPLADAGPPRWGPHCNTRCLASAPAWVTGGEAGPGPADPGDAELLTDPALYQPAVVWNDTAAPLGDARCWHHLFEAQAARFPEATAVEFDGTAHSYRELDHRANAVAGWLREQGIEPESVVAVTMDRSADVVAAVLGIAKAGAAFMLAQAPGPQERLRAALAEARAQLVLTDQALLAELSAQDLPAPVAVIPPLAPQAAPPVTGAGPGTSALVVFTSGTTGRPKAIINTHESLVSLFVAQRRVFGPGPGDRVAQFLSLNFDGYISECTLALLSGATLVVTRQSRLTVGPPLTRFLRDERITIAIMTPSVWSAIPHDELPDLRIAGFAGERLAARVVSRWAADRRRLLNLYGPAEAGIWATCHECAPDSPHDPPIGRPVANKTVYVMDSSGRPLPAGQDGELYIGGTGIGRYLRQGQLTAERFARDPLGGVLYRTGDICAWRRDGVLEYRGRRDRQVKIRGQRVELEEVERVLEHAPGVDGCTVQVRDDALVALVRPAAGAWDESAVRQHLRDRLHSGMIPGTFVLTDTLPLTPNGKSAIAAGAARHPVGGPVPGVSSETGRGPAPAVQHPDPGEAELTRLTWQVARLFATSLQVPQAAVKHDSDFFTLGGESLAMAVFLTELEDQFSLALNIDDLLSRPTPESIAAQLASAGQPRAEVGVS
jgi:amino acid adenylation domain-containing protein